MVTKYSGRTGSVKGRTKLVLTYSPTSVKNSTSSVKVTARLYYESTYRTQDSHNTAKMSGSLGSWSGSMSINGTSKLIKTLTKTVSTSYSGSKKITVSASLSGVEASPGSHSVSASITIPKRPVAKPNTPTNVNMALLSDNRTKTTWSHSTSTARPVSSYTVQYQRLDGGSWTGWMHSATVKGKSYTSNPGTNNKSYRRRVRANNSAGSSGWAYSNYVRMQPYAPVNVRAKVQPSGSDIKVTWDFNSPAETTCFKLQLQRRVNGGSWATVSSSFGQVKSKPYTSSYMDTNPGNGSNQYRIRILNNCEGDNSVWSESNTVSTIVPPKAPTNLSPDGKVVDFTGDVLFTWQHHDAGDGADQSHYDLRYRAEGESAWTYAPDGGNASEKSEHLFEGGELENGVNYEWQVKTQGNTKEDYGPWSKSAFVTGWTTPVVSIKDGAPPNPLTALPVPLAWTYAQDEGQGQIGWQARLYSVGSGDVFDSILEEKSAESSSTQTEFSTALADGGRYGIMVRARSSQGQWSEWSETTFDVELLVPAELRVDLEYGEDTGQMNLNIVSDEAVQGETAEVVSIDVQRRINGGEWVPIMVGIPFDSETTLVDNIPSIWGVNEYRVTATTEAPSKGVFGPFRKTVTPYVGNTENWLFLNYGETFDYMLRMQGDLSMSGSYDRSKETQKLLGRKKPISLLGQQLSREHQVTGTVEYHEECEFPDVPDVPRELVGSAFFDDARAWNFSKVQAGPDSQITADAHFRAKRYGYLMDVVDGNTENLVSPSPRSGVPGTEIPGREVEEVTARNLWSGSKLSEDRSAFSGSRWESNRLTDEGWEITGGDPGTGAYSFVYTATAYRVPVESDVPYSWAIPVKNTGTIPVPVRIMSWLERSTSGSVSVAEEFTLEPGETRVAKLENMAADNAKDIRFSLYYGANDPKVPAGGKITLLDGITLVQDAVAADPFNGDGAQTLDELLRLNVIPNGSFRNSNAGWGSGVSWPISRVSALSGASGYTEPYMGQAKVSGISLGVPSRSVWVNEPFTVSPGQWFSWKAWFSPDAGHSAQLQVTFLDASGDTVSTVDADLHDSNGNAGVWDQQTVQVPTGAVSAQPTIKLTQTGGGQFTGGQLSFGMVRGFVAPSEGETVAQLDPYFDGDTQGTGDIRYAYTGDSEASPSAEYQVADVLRKNLALDPIGPTVSGKGGLRVAGGGTPTVEVVDGRPVIAVRRNDYSSEAVYIDQGTNFTPPVGTVVHASCWVKVTEDTPIPMRMSMSVYNGAARTTAETERRTQAVADGWVKYEFTSEITAMPEGGSVRILFWPVTQNGSETVKFSQGEGYFIKDFLVEYDTTGPFFAFDTPDTYNRLYRKAPDGTSIELETDSQSLYRWTGAEADSESEKYLPAAPEHFDEYSEWLDVEPGREYEVEAFVKAPDLRSLSRRNLTSQGAFVTDRQLWGSESLSGGMGASWTNESLFETGGVRLSPKGLGFASTAYLGSGVKASTLGISSLTGVDFTLGIDAYAEEAPNATQQVYLRALDSAGSLIGNVITHEFTAGEDIAREVMHFQFPANTVSFDVRFSNSASNTAAFASNVTFEAEDTDGSWIDDSEGGREWFGAENIDSVQLMVEMFDGDGVSLGDPQVAGELLAENFSNRWRTITGEVSADSEARTMRVWVEWVVNGENPDRQSDWYFGGMKATTVYVVPDRWPGPDSNPDEWREAQYDSTTVCLRTPSGHRVFGAMSGLDINAVEGSLDLAEVSFTVTETDYTENPLVIDESDIWDSIVLEPHDDSLQVQPGEVVAQPGWGNIIVNPYSGGDA